MSVHRSLAALATLSLLLTACGGDADEGASGSENAGSPEAGGPTTVPEPSTVWVASYEEQALVKVDAATGDVEEIAVEDGPWQVDVVDDSVWIRSFRVQRIDPGSGEATDIGTEDQYAQGFLVQDDGVWVDLRDEDKLVRLDPESGETLEEVELQSEDVDLDGLSVDGSSLLAANTYDGTAVKIDLESGEIEEVYDPDAVVWDVLRLEDSLWVAHYSGLTELDAETFEVRREIEGVDDGVFALDVDEDGRLWVAQAQSVGTIDEAGQVETVVDAVTDTVDLGIVDDLKVSEDSVWITHGDAGLVRLDRETGELDEPIAIPGAGAFATSFEIALQ